MVSRSVVPSELSDGLIERRGNIEDALCVLRQPTCPRRGPRLRPDRIAARRKMKAATVSVTRHDQLSTSCYCSESVFGFELRRFVHHDKVKF